MSAFRRAIASLARGYAVPSHLVEEVLPSGVFSPAYTRAAYQEARKRIAHHAGLVSVKPSRFVATNPYEAQKKSKEKRGNYMGRHDLVSSVQERLNHLGFSPREVESVLNAAADAQREHLLQARGQGEGSIYSVYTPFGTVRTRYRHRSASLLSPRVYKTPTGFGHAPSDAVFQQHHLPQLLPSKKLKALFRDEGIPYVPIAPRLKGRYKEKRRRTR